VRLVRPLTRIKAPAGGFRHHISFKLPVLAGCPSPRAEVTMSNVNLAGEEEAWLQADPVLTLSGGRASTGQILFCVVLGLVVVMGTIYGMAN
jgi:hypothetical protein